MESIMLFLSYFFKANIVLAVLGIFYSLFLRKSVFYSFNRAYILIAVLAILILPLAQFPIDISKELFWSKSHTEAIVVVDALSVSAAEITKETTWFKWQYGALFLLFTGCFICFIRLVIQLFSLYLFIRKTKVRQMSGKRFNISDQLIGPFSFFGFICVNPDLYTEQELDEVLAHENTHVKQLHSVDILLIELLRCIFWINPFSYILRKEARQNLEYLADKQVVKMGFNTVHYQYTLLKVADSKILPVIVSEFRMSNLKKRIVMMNKSKVSKLGLFRYGLVVPLLALLWFFAAPVQAQEQSKQKEVEKEDTFMRVRGISTIGAENPPLIFVDGKEVTYIDNLETDQLASISVIKDSTATQLYGEKAKNGVILITTKDAEADIATFTLNQEDDDASLSSSITVAVEKSNGEHKALPVDVLYIIDGKETAVETVDLNTSDIISVTVLKKKSATEVYGEKGKNGVILITTKK